jgi:hypothetical protein
VYCVTLYKLRVDICVMCHFLGRVTTSIGGAVWRASQPADRTTNRLFRPEMFHHLQHGYMIFPVERGDMCMCCDTLYQLREDICVMCHFVPVERGYICMLYFILYQLLGQNFHMCPSVPNERGDLCLLLLFAVIQMSTIGHVALSRRVLTWPKITSFGILIYEQSLIVSILNIYTKLEREFIET